MMSEAISFMLSVAQVTNPVWGVCSEISNGTIDILVSPEKGGRVISYGLTEDKNVFWSNPKAHDYITFSGNWLNWGGEKTWIWRQDDWKTFAGKGWPPPVELDNMPYEWIKTPCGIAMKSEPLPACGLRACRAINASRRGRAMNITAWFEHIEGMPTVTNTVTPWSVSQIPASPKVYVRLCGRKRVDLAMQEFVPWPDPEQSGNILTFTAPLNSTNSYKMGLDADLIAAFTPAGLFIIRNNSKIDDTTPTPQAAQVFLDAAESKAVPEGKSYMELEFITIPRSASTNSEKLSLTFDILTDPPNHKKIIKLLKKY